MQHQKHPTMKAGEDLEAYRRVKINSSKEVVYADVTEFAQYITKVKVASGDYVGLQSINDGGSVEVIAEAACNTIGGPVYGRNNGMVSQSSADSAVVVGHAKRTCAVGETLEYEQTIG